MVSVAFARFAGVVRATSGSEDTRVAAAMATHSNASGVHVGEFFKAMMKGGGMKGVLRYILEFLV